MSELIVIGGIDMDMDMDIDIDKLNKDISQEENDKKEYAVVSWRAEDIILEAIYQGTKIELKVAENILKKNEKVIRREMYLAGWLAIEKILTKRKAGKGGK